MSKHKPCYDGCKTADHENADRNNGGLHRVKRFHVFFLPVVTFTVPGALVALQELDFDTKNMRITNYSSKLDYFTLTGAFAGKCVVANESK